MGHCPPRPDRHPAHRFASPPIQQRRVARFAAIDRPVKLRHHVIDPAFGQPLASVRVKQRVSIESPNLRWKTRPPYPEWTEAEGNPRFRGVDFLLQPPHEAVHVVPPPVAPLQLASAAAILRPGRIVRKIEDGP